MIWVVGIFLFLCLLFMFPKQLLILAFALGTIALIAIGYSERQAADRAKFKIAAVYGLPSCPPSHPISIGFYNFTSKPVEKVVFYLTGRMPKHSSSTLFERSESDRILLPGDSWSGCWQVPVAQHGAISTDPGKLEWSADVVYFDEWKGRNK